MLCSSWIECNWIITVINIINLSFHWIDQQPKEKLHEIKWWKIERYETTLVLRDKNWWIETIDKILCFYKDLQYYKEQGNLEILQKKIIEAKKRKKKIEALPLNDFQLISDEEDN